MILILTNPYNIEVIDGQS